MLRFSVVIPTLRRADTFAHALETAVAQDCPDCEIVVQNNGRDPETESIARRCGDRRVRHFFSEAVLSMTDNWELALANSRAEFVTFIGDDDGLFPDACRIAASVIDRGGFEIVSWHPFCYYWPNYIHIALRNRLIATIDYDLHAQTMSSEHVLRRYYRFALDYSHLPMIYNSFVRRSVIERARTRNGCYFLGHAPDVTSGIVNAALTPSYLLLSRPLSISGLSGQSTGHTAFLSDRGQAQANDNEFIRYRFDDRLIAANNLQLFLANEMLLVHSRMLADRRIPFDVRRLVEFTAAAINDRPDFYDETLAAIRKLAARHGIDLDEVAIPARLPERPTLKPESRMVAPGRVRMVIDGDRIALRTIADAVRLMTQIAPSAEDPGSIDIRSSRYEERAVLEPGKRVLFGMGGTGLPALVDGWGEPESWGTWTTAKRASLALAVDPGAATGLCLEMKYRVFLHPPHHRLDLECRAGGQAVQFWTLTDTSPPALARLAIAPEVVASNGAFDLEFFVRDPRSPAELGINADTRQLGIGIEWVQLIGPRSDRAVG